MTNARTLAAHLDALLRREHAAMADFLVTLADFDRRRLWLEFGHASLFYFLHRQLGLSKGAAHYRKTAAELIQRFPEIVEPLRDGRLCITSVVQLARVLTPENRHQILPRFFHLSKREALAVAVAIEPAQAAPHREVVTVVRVIPDAPAAQPKLPVDSALSRPGTAAPSVQLDELRLAPPPPAARDCAHPLGAELSRLHVTVSRRFLEKLGAARAALSHSHPGASAEEILEAGLDLVLARHAKRRGLVEKPRNESRPAKPAHVPARVKREVWKRDQGRCQWRLESGGICGSTLRVEFDHLVPRARGGPSTVGNVRLLCAVHNALAARRVFGDEWMNRFTSKRSAASDVPAAAAGP